MTVAATKVGCLLGQAVCQGALTAGAAVLFTSIGAVPALVFGGTKALLDFVISEISKKIFGGDYPVLQTVLSFTLSIVGAVAITTLVGFPMTLATGATLVLVAAVANIAMVCLCGAGVCCFTAVAASL